MVLVRLDSPHDITDGIEQLAGKASDAHQGFSSLTTSAALPRQFAQHGDLREAGADVVVQVGSDAVPDSLQLEQALRSVMVQPVHRSKH